MNTKFGEIADNLAKVEETTSPLQKKMTGLTRVLGILGIISSFIIFLLSFYLSNDGFFPSILLSISAAVAVVPESLPAVLTVTMAIGVKKMARKKAIIKNLASIEALGNVTLIATDKTGTLTTNVMRVDEIWFNNKIVNHKNLRSLFIKNGDDNFEISKIITNAIVCSTAALSKEKNLEEKKSNWRSYRRSSSLFS